MKKLLMSVVLGLSLIGSIVYADDWKPYDKMVIYLEQIEMLLVKMQLFQLQDTKLLK